MTSKTSFLDTLEGESAFFRALCDARPVGVWREFHMMTVQLKIQNQTGQSVTGEELWEKFNQCYNVELLESYVRLLPIFCLNLRLRFYKRKLQNLAVPLNPQDHP